MKARKLRPALLVLALFACGGDQPGGHGASPTLEDNQPADAPPQRSEPDAETDAALRRSIAEYRCKILAGKASQIGRRDGDFPATLEELLSAKDPLALPKNLEFPGGESDEALGRDPWGKPLAYEVNKGQVRVTSAGPDGELGTSDDISATEK